MPTKDPEALKAKRARENAKRKQDLDEARAVKANTPHLLTPSHNKILAAYEERLAKNKETKIAAKAAILRDDTSANISPGVKKAVEKNNPQLVRELQGLKEAPKVLKTALGSVVPDSRYTDALSEEPRQTKLNPINNDTRHHSVLTTIADKMGDKLDAAESKGQWSKHYETIAGHLADSHAFNDMSLQSHNYGEVEAAKRHFQASAEALTKAHASLDNREGVSLTPGIPHLITNTVRDYVHSTTPGVGAKPHNDFVERVLKERPTPQPKPEVKAVPKAPVRPLRKEDLDSFVSDIPENPRAITTSKSPRERADMRLAVAKKLAEQKGKKVSEFRGVSSAELERPEIDTSSIGKETGFTGQELVGQQIRNYMDGR